MDLTSSILIFDIGKTNKKYFVLDESYKIIDESSVRITETIDEDGFPSEDIHTLIAWLEYSFKDVITRFDKKINAVNFSAYGASLVHVDAALNPVAPLYNYLKPYPEKLKQALHAAYGGEEAFSLSTSSPSLGSLNSGLQLYRLKKIQPELFEKINFSLHLPQYLSSRFSREAYSEITSLGCHTALWDFSKNNYHNWVTENNIIQKLAPLLQAGSCFTKIFHDHLIKVGIGLHDSSAALLTYLHLFPEPFLLLSTGTWSISLNPFNDQPLTHEELRQDCLCYLTDNGNAVKASRLFAGKWHEEMVIKMALHFQLKPEYFSEIKYRPEILKQPTGEMDLNQYSSAEEAYHHFMYQLVKLQAASSKLALGKTNITNIYVDGGFSKNELFMYLMAEFFPTKNMYAASVAQASAFGAAMVIHKMWNNTPLPYNLVKLHHYKVKKR